ncbi:MAG: hypothetical protein NC915_01510 [Candidatus Omnitrophica bacterium]|nr:hypothetical protein [Candidatus Omnitrophota bacterium]
MRCGSKIIAKPILISILNRNLVKKNNENEIKKVDKSIQRGSSLPG